MATLICNATGNLTGASTFAAVETGTGALSIVRNNHIQHGAAATNTSSTFTVTNGSVIDGAIVWICNEFAGTPNGTLKVDLLKGGVSQASVTVNKADLPLYANVGNLGPVFFRFTGTAVGDGGANWTLATTSTGSTTLRLVHSGSAANFTRALRKTTAATPAAGDDLLILGELTGAGTHTAYTVTMNSTAATDYGNGALNSGSVGGGLVAIGMWGTLTYGTAASTNYILRVSGDVIAYYLGTLNIGSSGAEIPRNSTAVLELDQASADGDFGLRCLDGSTVNIAGLSRTSGKNITKCKLTSDLTEVSEISGLPSTSSANANIGLDASGNSLTATAITATSTTAIHIANAALPAITNTTQTATVWITRGSGTHNRYVRVAMAATTALLNGFYSDIDLQAGTAGTVTAAGNGTATSVSMVPMGTGFLIKMTGKISSAAASNPFFILYCCAVSGVTSYAGDSTQNFIYDHMSVVNAASISDATFNVDTDTGWLSGDAVCVAPTTRAAVECEIFPLSANAGASSFTSALQPFYTHHGTAPTQAEIGLITRNVKIRSTSTTLMAYMYCTALSTVTVSWAEIYYVGSNVANKRGIEIDAGATTNAKSFTYCSIHDCDYAGVYFAPSTSTSLNVTFSNNVMWCNYAAGFLNLAAAITNNDYTLDNNLVMGWRAVNTPGIYLGDIGGTITNNTSVGSIAGGASSYGFQIAETAAIGTFSGNTSHTIGGAGLVIITTGITGTISNFTSWRNGGSGINTSTNEPSSNLIFDNLTLFGSVVGFFTGGLGAINITGTSVICGETGYASQYGLGVPLASPVLFNVTGVDFTGVGFVSSPAAHTTGDISFVTASTFTPLGYLNNCKFNTTHINSKTAWVTDDIPHLGFQNFNQVSGDHRMDMKYGQIRTDTVNYNTASPAAKLLPSSAVYKLKSAPLNRGALVAVNSGATVAASVWVRKDAIYSGSQPRLMVRANPSIGILTDTVLVACSDVTSSSSFPTWDATTAINVGVSGGNLVLLNDGGVDQNNQGIHVSSAYEKTEGRFYFENTLTTRVGGTSVGFGIGVIGSTYPNMGGGNALVGTMTYIGGQVASNGVSSGNLLGSRATGDVWGIAVDLGNRRAWFRVTVGASVSGWTTGGDPTLGTGGTAIPAGAMVPFATFGGAGNSSNNRFTTNFGSSAFATAAPTGYLAGWGAPTGSPGTATWVQISGTSPVATNDGVMEFFVDCDAGGYIDIEDWVFA